MYNLVNLVIKTKKPKLLPVYNSNNKVCVAHRYLIASVGILEMGLSGGSKEEVKGHGQEWKVCHELVVLATTDVS